MTSMTATKTPLIAADHGRDCPACKTGRLELFVTLSRAENPEADNVNTSGERKGKHFHTVADCQSCGAFFEVAN